jgi:hypothetical protein
MIAKGVYGVSPYKMIAKGVYGKRLWHRLARIACVGLSRIDIRYIIYRIFLYVYILFRQAKVERNLLKIIVTHFFFLLPISDLRKKSKYLL